jgi:hypothetical protein
MMLFDAIYRNDASFGERSVFVHSSHSSLRARPPVSVGNQTGRCVNSSCRRNPSSRRLDRANSRLFIDAQLPKLDVAGSIPVSRSSLQEFSRPSIPRFHSFPHKECFEPLAERRYLEKPDEKRSVLAALTDSIGQRYEILEAKGARWLFLAFVREVTRYMTLDNVRRSAMVVADEFVAQPSPGKVGLRLRKDRLSRPSVHGDG